MTERCGKWMPRSKAYCMLPAGHKHYCGSRSLELGRVQAKAYLEANREAVNARKRAHYQANREAERARQRAWYEANREVAHASSKEWYEANREAAIARKKEYRDSERGRAIQALYTETGYHAEACSRHRRRKAQEHDDALLEALTRRS